MVQNANYDRISKDDGVWGENEGQGQNHKHVQIKKNLIINITLYIYIDFLMFLAVFWRLFRVENSNTLADLGTLWLSLDVTSG